MKVSAVGGEFPKPRNEIEALDDREPYRFPVGAEYRICDEGSLGKEANL